MVGMRSLLLLLLSALLVAQLKSEHTFAIDRHQRKACEWTDAKVAGGRLRRRKRFRPKNVVAFGSHVPNLDEFDERAAGPVTGAIEAGSRNARRLVFNDNSDIEFWDEEMEGRRRSHRDRHLKSYEDHYSTLQCNNKLNHLAWLVKARWPGVFLRVLEGWDQEGRHGVASLHYEGRAFDLTSSEVRRAPLEDLAGLALSAGFDHVSHHSRDYIHVSCRREWRNIYH